jgi:hypothetical protein
MYFSTFALLAAAVTGAIAAPTPQDTSYPTPMDSELSTVAATNNTGPVYPPENTRRAIFVALFRAQGSVSTKMIDFTAADLKGLQLDLGGVGEPFQYVHLSVGANVPNQGLRCRLVASDGNVILVSRGGEGEKNRQTFSDMGPGGKGHWNLDEAGDGIARVKYVQCNPSFA